MSKTPPTPEEMEITRAKAIWGLWDVTRRFGVFLLILTALPRYCSQQEIDQQMRKSALSETLMNAADAKNWKNDSVLALADVQKDSVPLYNQKKAAAERGFYIQLMIFGGMSLMGHLGATRSKRKLQELGAFKDDDNGPSPSP